MTRYHSVQAELAALGDADKAAHLQGFFKTGPGQYGEGDVFRGIRVPALRRVARKNRSLSLEDTAQLLSSRYHEDRFVALCIMVLHYERAHAAQREAIYTTYLSNTRWVNSWDLVDASAHKIVGPHLEHKSRAPLYALAVSQDLWERRIAIMATLHFIKRNDFADTLKIAALLLADPHDLIHKAVGWMLREVGKRSFEVQDVFMRTHYVDMSRTMLRYAIERYPEPLRQSYLKGTVSIR